VNARASDFAFVSAAAQIELDADNKCKRIAIGVGAATDHPIRLDSAERQLTGGALDPDAVRAAVEEALANIEPLDDLHATAAYRRRVAAVLAARAVADALGDAQGGKAQRTAHAH
jgi:CO/xanthine dehydrogenase FAD-binding subunit